MPSCAKRIFKPEKINGTHTHILPVEMTKCTLGDLFAAVNIKPHVQSYHRSYTTHYFYNANTKVRRPKQEVSARFKILSSVVLQCIVGFPLLVSHFDECTLWEQRLTCNTQTKEVFIMSVISASSATYRHKVKRRAYKHDKITFHIQHFTVRASLFSFLASK